MLAYVQFHLIAKNKRSYFQTPGFRGHEIDFYNENVNPENSIYKVYEWKDNRDEVVFE